jgi:hypothetical protein
VAKTCGIFLLFVLFNAVPAPAHDLDPEAVVLLRVYRHGARPPDVLDAGLREAAAVLAAAGATMTSLICGDDHEERRHRQAACDRELAANEIVLRIVSDAGETQRTDGAAGVVLGYSVVGATTPRPIFATVYFDRVRTLADSGGVDTALLLGWAIAHELGHLLLGTPQHAAKGLMRAFWNRAELHHFNVADWRFSAREAASVRVAAAARSRAEWSMASVSRSHR